jgi:predicted nucleic acid-binding protein
MRTVFVDTAYWVARTNRRDQWYQKAREISARLTNVSFLTTELVLVEYLNYFSAYEARMREQVSITTQNVLTDPNIQIVWQTQALFEAGLNLYKSRLDKGYSLTDCISMVVMQQSNIQETLTHDRHFAQEGFAILM